MVELLSPKKRTGTEVYEGLGMLSVESVKGKIIKSVEIVSL